MADRAKINRRDHIVPKGYLAGFTRSGEADDRLYAFDIARNRWFGTKPEKVGFLRGFYDYSTDSAPDATADDAFFEFESRFPEIRRELVSSNFLNWRQHLDFLVRYSQMLRERSQLYREESLTEIESSAYFKRANPSRPRELDTTVRYAPYIPEGSERNAFFKNLAITRMREEFTKGAGELAGWHWFLRYTDDIGAPVITADNPVGLISFGPMSRDAAMAHPETIFVFPLCWQACLFASPKEYDETGLIPEPLLAELHKMYLTRPDSRFAYSPGPLSYATFFKDSGTNSMD